jgi:hypothetical protein
MANRRLTERERSDCDNLLDVVRDRLSALDPEARFAMRRRLIVKLTHDERGTPAHRNKLKALKRIQQGGRCPICGEALPEKYCELDRFRASAGYTPENTRLVHHQCHINDQASKAYK